MKIDLIVSPPKLMPWLTSEEKDANIMQLDFEADLDSKGVWRLDLNVAFNPRSVQHGRMRKTSYYIGSTGGEIKIELTDGKILDHTKAVVLDVAYAATTTTKRETDLALIPDLKVKAAKNQIAAKVGSISHKRNNERSYTNTFKSEERLLAPVKMHNTVRWSIKLPRGRKVISDFLEGNLYLFATCTWKSNKTRGSVSVRPSDVQIFNNDKEPLGSLRSILMMFVLYLRKVRLQNTEGLEVGFREVVNGKLRSNR